MQISQSNGFMMGKVASNHSTGPHELISMLTPWLAFPLLMQTRSLSKWKVSIVLYKASFLRIYAEIGCSRNATCRTEGMQTKVQIVSGRMSYRTCKIVKERNTRSKKCTYPEDQNLLSIYINHLSATQLPHHASYYQIQSSENF
jgi:hypothetical protein